MILSIHQGGFFGARTADGKLYIEDKYLRKYTPNNINPTSKRDNITCGYKTCISAMLLQSYINKWRLSQLSKIDQLYMNSASTRIL